MIEIQTELWKKGTMRILIAALVVVALAGCGSSKTAKIGAEGEKGVIARDIDSSRDVSAKADQMREAAKEAY